MPPIFSVLAAACARIVRTLPDIKLARYLTAVCCFVVVAGLFFDTSHAADAVTGWLAGNTGSAEFLAMRPTRAAIAPRSVTVATTNGSLNIERSGHTATDLGDGKVLLVGGDNIGTAEIYDTAHGTAYFTGSLSAARSRHTATKLPDGRVLIAGGSSSDGDALAATEIYDPATGNFSAGISLKAPRSGHTATVLADGRTVFIGGDEQGTAEIFDPQTGRGKLLEAMVDGARAGHAATLLQNGKILIVGGKRGEAELNTAELFDPATLTFAPSRNSMRVARVRPNLRVLPDGKVQVIGGDEAGSMEMFNAGGGYFTAYARLLDNVLGRANTLRANTRSGLFHKRTPGAVDTGVFSEVLDRADYSLTEISRYIVVAGGVNSSGDKLRSVVMLVASSATVTTDQTDYQPGDFVIVRGGGWLPGENVRLTLHRDNETPDTTLNATADAEGNIANSEYLVQVSDLNLAFLLTAVGQTSGYTAQTTFTDSVNPITITAPVSASPVTVTSLPATIAITFTYSTGATGSTNAFVAVKDSLGATIVASPTQLIPTTTSTTSATINVTIPAGTANASNYSSFAQVTNTVTPGTITRQDINNNAVIVNVPVPAKLAFITSPFTAIAGRCGSPSALPITMQLQDAAGNKAQSTTNTTVNLTSSSAGGTFYSDAQCTRAVTSIVISNAGNSGGFYYKDSMDGTPTITAADAANALPSATQIETIVAPPSACASPGFAAAMNFAVGDQHLSMAVGDFNADGKADVAAVNSGSSSVSILLGNGAGSFTAATNFAVGVSPHSVAIGDFNADGRADIATANQSSNNVSILLGNGAGGFAAATNFAVGSLPFSVAVGDFNADGKTDVVTANFNSTAVSILLNNGAGGFAAATNFNVGISPQSVAVGDFNADGRADLVAANSASSNVSILLGNGAGGFSAATNFPVGAGTVSVAVGDFNGDSKVDVATANSNPNNVSILLGNGAGGFAAAANFPVGTAPASIAIGDFNADGKADITTANQNSNNISILIGNGVGGFATVTNFASANIPRSVAVGDFNGDGRADIATAGQVSNNVSILLNSCISAPDLTLVKTHSGNFTIGTNGNYVLTVSNAGGAAATSGTITVTDTLPSGLSFVSGTGTGWSCSAGGQNVTCANSNSLAAGASSPAITLTVSVGASTAVGTNSITNTANVSVTGETNTGNNSASDPTTVNKGNQTIAFGALADKTYGDADFAVSATASSGLTVSYAASGNCTVSGTTVHITGAGNCTLTASQPGNPSYNAAPDAVQSFTIYSKTLTANITVSNKVYDGTTAATILTRTLTGVVGADDVTLTGGTATFATKTAGTAKTVTATGLTLSGTAAGNYVLSFTTTTTTADITPRTLNVSATAQNKTYDGTTAATVTLSDDRVSGDDVTTSYATASFADKDAGSNKPVSVSGISIGGGADGGNYSLGNTTTTTAANITPRPIAITADAKMKTYGDGDPALTYSLTSGSLVMGDGFGGALTRVPGENAGAYAIQQGTLTAGGNYALTFEGADLTITERSITITADARTKVYGDQDPPLTYQITSGSLAFSDAFTGALVRVSGELVGSYAIQQGTLTAGTNYAMTYIGADLSITPKMLTVAATAINKVYDGNATASVSLSIPTGIVLGDTVGATYASASFADRNVGMGKTVSISGIALTGASAGNYTVNSTATTNADITQRTLTVTATAANKVYDGSANASVTLFDNRIAGDVITVGFANALFDDANIGANKTVTVSGIAISGGDASNYIPASTVTTTSASITPAGTTIVSVSPNTVQYSDTVTFTATIPTPNTNLNGQVAGTVQFCINGANFGAPVAAILASTGATAALTFNNQLAPGNYTVAAKFISSNPNFGNSNSGDAPLTITREDARVFYNGMLFVNTSCATCSNATVQLAATVKDITAVTGDAAFDAQAGNISNATLTFVNADTNVDIATVPISLVSAGDTTVGTAVYDWSVNLGSADSSDYTIGFRVNGYYTRYAGSDAAVLTVSKPLGTNFITGGGYLMMTSPATSSAGLYAGAPGLHTNFSFNVKYSNGGKSLQGMVNVIVRGNGGRVYQFKGNQMDTLTVNNANPQEQTAVYTGKCSLTDITDPNAPIALGEGHGLQMKMTDKGEPGSADIIGITVYANTNGALLFSSRWNGTTTIEQLLGGGNISIK